MHLCPECGGLAIDVAVVTPERAAQGRRFLAYAICTECGHQGPTVTNADPKTAKRLALNEWNRHADLGNRCHPV